MSGFVGNLSKKQEDALGRFRASLTDVWRKEFDSDPYLLRWLRARNFDVKKSEKMLRAHLVWRKENGADTILENYRPNEVMQRYFPGGFCGHSKEGNPLWVDPTGYGDMKGIIKSVPLAEIIRNRVYLLELIYNEVLPRRSAAEGKLVEQTVVIFDLEHFGMRHMWKPGLDVHLEVTRILEANYPETMGKCFVINAPSFFPALYAIVKPFLHEETQRKVQVLGSNYREVLLRHFDPANLPARYGGLLRDADGCPDCRAHICYGGAVPKELYIRCDQSAMTEQAVARGSTLKLEQHVASAGARLHWEFLTDDHDIGFGVFLKEAASERSRDWRPVVESRRVSCHITPERGSCVCPAAGVYVVRFDNSFSWTRAKKVWYRLTLEEEAAEGDVEVGEDEEEGEEGKETTLGQQLCVESSKEFGSNDSFHSAVSHISS